MDRSDLLMSLSCVEDVVEGKGGQLRSNPELPISRMDMPTSALPS